ncbi:unnamed protein product, partial [Choristocarpus tenellus]
MKTVNLKLLQASFHVHTFTPIPFKYKAIFAPIYNSLRKISSSVASMNCAEGVDVSTGPLVGPVSSLTFSADGAFLFASSGSFLYVYEVKSGLLRLSKRIFDGVTIGDLDIGDGKVGAIFGHRLVKIVTNIPNRGCVLYGALGPIFMEQRQCHTEIGDKSNPATFNTALWFSHLVTLPELEDRAWDVRLICNGGNEEIGGALDAQCCSCKPADSNARGERAWMAHLVAVALAHHSVEIWDWGCRNVPPSRVLRARSTEPCLLYHARLFGRTLRDLRVAAGTVYNQVLVWRPSAKVGTGFCTVLKGSLPLQPGVTMPAKVMAEEQGGTGEGDDASSMPIKGDRRGGIEAPKTMDKNSLLPSVSLPRSTSSMGLGRDVVVPPELRLVGHEGVIFRVAWDKTGHSLGSVSDDRTVRVWNSRLTGDDSADAHASSGKGAEVGGAVGGKCGETGDTGRLLLTGWGHSSRVWDVAFCSLGVVTSGEDGNAILWRESNKRQNQSLLSSQRNSNISKAIPTTINVAQPACSTIDNSSNLVGTTLGGATTRGDLTGNKKDTDRKVNTGFCMGREGRVCSGSGIGGGGGKVVGKCEGGEQSRDLYVGTSREHKQEHMQDRNEGGTSG